MVATGWKQLLLGEVITLQRGFDLPNRERKAGSVPIVSSSGVIDKHNEARVTGPGVVTGRYGTIGDVFFIENDFWPLNTTLFVSDFKGNDELFVSFLLQTIEYHLYSGKSGVPGVNRNDLHEIKVLIPPLLEQRAIAATLSDLDALLASQDALIAKKRDIKQAAMQELLTGRVRLPSFEGEWQMKQLGEIVEKIVGGGTPNRSRPEYWNGDILWATVKDFATFNSHSTQETITELGLKNSASNLIPRGKVILSTRMLVGSAVIFDVDVSINQDLKAIFQKSDMHNVFLYYWFQLNSVLLESLGSGSTVKSISLLDLKSLEFLKPPPDEQIAIAAVLSDMDAEIAALEARRAKTVALKQGMMQELLTGKTRLV